jgi:kynurenine formamidase
MKAPDINVLHRLLDGCATKWGHWGLDDEVGALNYLGEREVQAGLATVRNGRVFTLGAPLASPGGDPVFPGRWAPRHFVVADKAGFRAGHWRPLPGGLEFADDYVTGFAQASTHCDALGHMWYGDKLWNGYHADCTNGGMKKAGIEPISKRGIVGKCVLIDVARFRGVEALRRAETFDHIDLLACAKAQDVEIEPRTILLLRTGWLGRLLDGREAIGSDYWEPGLTFSRDLVAWFDAMQIPCLVTDTLANETTYESESGVMLPLHGALMRNLGIVFTEAAWLDDLAADCAGDRRYHAFYCASPIKVVGGTGGSINPVVLK